jgi:hypothetical protein
MPTKTLFPTLGVVRSPISRLALLSLLFLSGGGCDNNSPIAPAPPPPRPATPPPPVTLTTVKLEGRVLDEINEPVRGATIQHLYPPDGSLRTTTTDDTGSFSLTVERPANRPGITLHVEREGYESADIHVEAAEASSEVLLKTYRSLTIIPGEFQATLSLPTSVCWWEPICRRATVSAPPGKLLNIKVVPADGLEYAGLAGRDQLQWGYNFPNELTVPGGADVWIAVRQFGRVTIIATER